MLGYATFRPVPLILTSDDNGRDSNSLKMRLLMTVLALAMAVDNAMGECSTFQTQINVSMCNWQGLRGMNSSVSSLWTISRGSFSFSLLTVVATVLRDTLYLDGGKLWYQR